MEKSFKKLLVWQKADNLCRQIYIVSRQFPKDELYGLTSQLRRAAVSVSTNIVEGSARRNNNEFRQFVNIAIGSLAETEYLMELSLNLEYLGKNEYDQLELIRRETGAMLFKLYQSLKPET